MKKPQTKNEFSSLGRGKYSGISIYIIIVISKFIIASLLAFSLGCMAFVCKAMFYLIFLLQDLAPVTCMVSLTKPGKRE